MSPAPNIEGRILASGKYFGVAFYKDGRIAVKDFVGEADLLKGITELSADIALTPSKTVQVSHFHTSPRQNRPDFMATTPSSLEQARTPTRQEKAFSTASLLNGRTVRRFSTSQSTSTLCRRMGGGYTDVISIPVNDPAAAGMTAPSP